MKEFRRAYWESRFTRPDWYLRVEDDLRELFFPLVHHDAELKRFRHQVYELVEELLERDAIPLARQGPDLDSERQPVALAVIHHTEEEPGIRLSKLSAIGLVRQYAFQYVAGEVLGRSVQGEPIWSGHFRAGKMVFFAYHWLIRPDGTVERLLDDAAIGWHAGDWATNTRSVGIALSGDYEDATPPSAQIEATARLIRARYPQVRVLGHHEVVAGITCPGAYFLGRWKQTLLNRVFPVTESS